MRLWLPARFSAQEGPPGTGQRFSSICSAPSSHFCYMAGDPLDLTGVNPELREGWAFATEPKQPPAPPTPRHLSVSSTPPLPRGHRKHTTNQPAHCPAQHQPSPPRCPADTPPAPGLSQAAPAAPAQGPAPPTELHSGAQSIHEKETLSRQALSFSIASIQISKRLHYKPQW